MICQLLLILCVLHTSQGAVLGIDFGTNFAKVSVVAPGKAFQIVIDPSSKRKIPTIVGFDNGERRFGNAANSLVTKRPTETFGYMHRLLGKSIDTPVIEEIKKLYFPYEFVSDDNRNTIRVKMGEQTFSVEEIVAMYLKHIQEAAVKYLESKTPVRDCVITVPDFYSTKERRALLDAAGLAGLNVLSVINENSAAALSYGINYDYKINETKKFIFYNMGSTSTKVTVVEYSAFNKTLKRKKSKAMGMVKVLGSSWDEFLGGNDFDMVIVEELKRVAEEDFNAKLTSRSMGRLRIAAEKTKRVLNTLREHIVRITSLWEDEDFKYTMTRELLYKNAEKLFQRAILPLDEVLKKTDLKKSEIEGIVLMGGSSRIQKLQELLQDWFDPEGKRELLKNLNTDEAAAVGAAFRAANMSTAFRIRQIGFLDRGIPTGVNAKLYNFEDYEAAENGGPSLEDAEFSKRATIFKPNTQFKKRKVVHFKHSKSLFVSLFHADDSRLPVGTQPPLDNYNISGVERAIEEYSQKNVTDTVPKLSLSFSVDDTGIIRVSKATATFIENVRVAIPRIKNITTNETSLTNGTTPINGTTSTNGTVPTNETTSESGTTDKCINFKWPPKGTQFCSSAEPCPSGMICGGCTASFCGCDVNTGELTCTTDCMSTCQKAEKSDEKSDDVSEKSDDDSEKSDDVSEKSDNVSEKSDGNCEKSDGECEKSETSEPEENDDDKDPDEEADDKNVEDHQSDGSEDTNQEETTQTDGKKDKSEAETDEKSDENPESEESQKTDEKSDENGEKDDKKKSKKEKKKKKSKKEKEKDKASEIEYDYEWQTKKRKVVLHIRKLGADIIVMNRTQKRNSTQVLIDLDDADQAIRDTAEAFNSLEAFILEHRPYLQEDENPDIMKVSTEEERTKFITLLTETEDWLYDEEEPSAGKFKSKLREITLEVQPLFSRAYELASRGNTVETSRLTIRAIHEYIANMTKEMTWVNKTTFDELTNKTNKLSVWIDKKMAEQQTKKLTEKPAFKTDDLKNKIKKLTEEVQQIQYIPKPKEKKKKKKKKKKSKSKKSNETVAEDASEAKNETGETVAEDASEAEAKNETSEDEKTATSDPSEEKSEEQSEATDEIQTEIEDEKPEL